ncbi:LytTR family DNA-binding domain-containing protein [Asticcacaulis sp. 201]|uniref:LytTR family DNA-binding domain-containing protein n=1 Tax=Asticcacaulis sp. 201 TaxID=3028787 RepID=UPI002915EFDE|nr:LytTR family DNA-binding domain-containing protein [Asticcacaulis sp. 201]MDV6330035.1 LytTR family DNA-binding domain-containing protein [Asticcacaulis sp. 201]
MGTKVVDSGEFFRETRIAMNERSKTTVRASPDARPWNHAPGLLHNTWVHGVAGATFMALLLSTTTALGTASLPFLGRTAYWLMEMLLGAAIIGAILFLMRPISRRRLYLRTAVLVGVGTPLIVLMAWLTTEPIKGNALAVSRITSYLPGVLPIVGFNALVQILFGRKELAGMAAGAVDSEPSTEPRETIYAIEAQAHYVVYHTSQGKRRELIRFYDAVKRVSVDGSQVHRSWWVAYAAIESADLTRKKLRLVNGEMVPISRSRLPAVRHIVTAMAAN